MPGADPSDLAVVHRLAAYEPLVQFSAGGMADVFLARTRTTPPAFCVIKTLPKRYAQDSDRIAMFIDETRIARLLRHPNLVSLLDADTIDGEPYLALEFIHGPSLRELATHARTRGSPIDLRLSASLIIGACEGLHYAHELKSEWGEPLRLVHRDVTPQNIMVRQDGVVTVLDFGVARAVGQTHETATRMLKGKLAYIAPEYIHGMAPDRRADIFALGIVLYELLTNHRLFYRASAAETIKAVLEDSIVYPSELNSAVPRALDRAVLTALERDQESRWVSARAFRDALVKAVRGIGGIMTPGEIAELLQWDFEPVLERYNRLRADMPSEVIAALLTGTQPLSVTKSTKHEHFSVSISGWDGTDVDLSDVEGPSVDEQTEIDIYPPSADDTQADSSRSDQTVPDFGDTEEEN